MNKLHAILVLILSLSSAAVMAESDTYTALDEELPTGLTVAQTLAAWDNSSVRYRSEPPVAKQTQHQNSSPKASASEKS